MCRTRKAFPEVLQNISSFQDKVRKSDPAKANASAGMNLAGVKSVLVHLRGLGTQRCSLRSFNYEMLSFCSLFLCN